MARCPALIVLLSISFSARRDELWGRLSACGGLPGRLFPQPFAACRNVLLSISFFARRDDSCGSVNVMWGGRPRLQRVSRPAGERTQGFLWGGLSTLSTCGQVCQSAFPST